MLRIKPAQIHFSATYPPQISAGMVKDWCIITVGFVSYKKNVIEIILAYI